MSTIPMIARKIRMPRVISTQIPKLPTVDSIRSPQGYGEHAATLFDQGV